MDDQLQDQQGATSTAQEATNETVAAETTNASESGEAIAEDSPVIEGSEGDEKENEEEGAE
jgi:hypothetical protein